MNLPFRKMHGLGNDFVIIDRRNRSVFLTQDQIIRIADRHRGVGCDQIVFIDPATDADVSLEMFNADGSTLEACGNATRCVADMVMKEKQTNSATIHTVVGILHCSLEQNGLITADMGIPRTEWQDIPLSKECDTLHLPLEFSPVAVNIGNPHCVFFVPDAERHPVAEIGSAIEVAPLFPRRTNVEFATVLAPDKIRFRVWERGAGITQACGSGACAVLVAAVRRGLSARKAEIILDGGTLWIEWRESDGHILMTGAATYVFDGIIKDL